MMQRIFDIFFSGIALLLLSPFLIPICIILRFSGEGEVFYLQERIGRSGNTFKLFKFATMLKNSPNMCTGTVTVKGDPRVLPIGKFLRKSKINELPQLLNIFVGDMSVIGPRPLTKQTFSAYPEDIQNTVKQVRPGLSGIGSIIFRGEEDILANHDGALGFYNDVIAPYKGALECWYVAHQGMVTYFKCIIVTVLVVVLPKSTVAWRLFSRLPTPPETLLQHLHYPN